MKGTFIMKTRILSLIFSLALLFSLASCNLSDLLNKADKNETSEGAPVDVRVYTLNGTTGFGMAKLMEDAAAGAFTNEKYTFSVKYSSLSTRECAVNPLNIFVT